MLDSGDPTFETSKCKLSFRKSKTVEVPNIDLLDPAFIVTKTEITPDKKAIKAAIEAGENVAGAFIEEKQNIQIK